MADIVTTDPKALESVLAQVEQIKAQFASMYDAHANRPTRGKYEAALRELENAELPLIELSITRFPNTSIASMQSQFKRAAQKMGLSYSPSVVSWNDSTFLVNFDGENAERKFNEYIMRKAGISAEDLAKVTRELDSATK